MIFPANLMSPSLLNMLHLVLYSNAEYSLTCFKLCWTELCEKSLKNAHGLYTHNRDVHIKLLRKDFKCSFCDKAFLTNGNLKHHLLGVHEQNKMTCETCGKVFQNKTKLSAHILHSHNMKESQCKICGKILKTIQLRKRH